MALNKISVLLESFHIAKEDQTPNHSLTVFQTLLIEQNFVYRPALIKKITLGLFSKLYMICPKEQQQYRGWHIFLRLTQLFCTIVRIQIEKKNNYSKNAVTLKYVQTSRQRFGFGIHVTFINESGK